LNIAEIRVYRGPNIWCRTPVIMLLLEPGELSDETSARIPGFAERLRACMPSLRTEGFRERLSSGMRLDEAVLTLALELQRAAGVPVDEGGMQLVTGSGTSRVIYPYRNEEVGRAAGRLAVRLVTTLVSSDNPGLDLAQELLELATLAKATGLGPSTAAIVAAAEARSIPFSRPDKERSFVILGQGNRQRRVWATVTEGTNLVATRTASDKALTSRLLHDAGIPVPDGAATTDVEYALVAAGRIGYPVVVKPLDGNHGRGVTMGVADADSMHRAFATALEASSEGRVLVQRQVLGRDFRVLVVGGEVVAVAERVPAHVIGDGQRTMLELAEAVNADPRRGEGHSSVLTRIDTGQVTTSFLATQGLTWESVPLADQQVFLSGAANLSTGGTAIDRTDDIHPVNAQLAREAALIVGLDVAGIDIVTPDIAYPLAEQGGAIVEVNTAPGFRMHTHPSEGQSRPVAEAVLNQLFPAGATGRIPIVAVTGTNGKTTTTRMVAHLLRQDGRCVGLTTTDGIYIGDRLAAAGDMAGPKSARLVLQHPLVQAAALETARGGIVREGLGFDQCDVGIVMSVTSDHLGLGGVYTLEDLARVKGVVPAAVAPTGASVLNADDPLVMGMVPHAGGEIILFSAHEESPVLREHIGRGGRGAVLARTPGGDLLRLVTPDGWHDLILSEHIPATMGGLLWVNAVNALVAAAAAWSLGVPIQTIRDGLATFEAGIETTPGRFNFLEVEGRHVLIDYAHNVAALEVLGDVVRRFGAPRSVAMVALPGDRSNEDTIALGAQTSRMFDTLVVREGNHRGRPAGESAGLIRQGALSTGMPESEIHIVLDEVEAAHAAVDVANPDDLVVILVTRPGLIWDELSSRASRASAALYPEVEFLS
jgi:cyanophycin synthetase